MKNATFTWTVNVDVREDFDQNNPEHFTAARREAWMNVHENNGALTETEGDDDDELCPECGNYQLVPVMNEVAGKTLVEGKRCPDAGCGYNS